VILGVYQLSDALRWAAKRAEIKPKPVQLSSHERAISLLENSIFGEVNLAAIQGPPGTGKTSVIEGFAERRLDELLTGEKLLVYIAPTNHLVFEAFRRMARLLLQKGYGPRDILFCTRVYGSRISPGWEKGTLEVGGDALTPEDLKRLVSGIDTDEVRLVFATEFQRVTARVQGKMGGSVRMHVVADEASKTPFFRVFLPIAEEVVKNPESYPLSLTVLGDPQQAITVPEAMKAYRIPLLMRHVERILEEHGMMEERFQMLDMTFRLPGPSEVPISYGYYDQKLHALYRAEERLRLLEEAFVDNRSAVERSLSRMGIDPFRTEFKKILDGLEEALKAHSPVFVIRTNRFPAYDTFEPRVDAQAPEPVRDEAGDESPDALLLPREEGVSLVKHDSSEPGRPYDELRLLELENVLAVLLEPLLELPELRLNPGAPEQPLKLPRHGFPTVATASKRFLAGHRAESRNSIR